MLLFTYYLSFYLPDRLQTSWIYRTPRIAQNVQLSHAQNFISLTITTVTHFEKIYHYIITLYPHLDWSQFYESVASDNPTCVMEFSFKFTAVQVLAWLQLHLPGHYQRPWYPLCKWQEVGQLSLYCYHYYFMFHYQIKNLLGNF